MIVGHGIVRRDRVGGSRTMWTKSGGFRRLLGLIPGEVTRSRRVAAASVELGRKGSDGFEAWIGVWGVMATKVARTRSV